jgi:uncharacterized protein (DUF952 family)
MNITTIRDTYCLPIGPPVNEASRKQHAIFVVVLARPTKQISELPLIYHLAIEKDWSAASAGDIPYVGGAQDIGDGFVHLSTRDQIEESAARHRAGERGLLLLAVDESELGEALRWETSRGGALFPHCYGPIPLAAVVWTAPLPLAPDNRHIFPDLSD